MEDKLDLIDSISVTNNNEEGKVPKQFNQSNLEDDDEESNSFFMSSSRMSRDASCDSVKLDNCESTPQTTSQQTKEIQKYKCSDSNSSSGQEQEMLSEKCTDGVEEVQQQILGIDDPSSRRKYVNEDPSHPNWPLHKKHMFILSNAGKPVYSRYGDEQNLAAFMASLTAMVSYVQDMKDNLRYVIAGEHKFVFLVQGHLILVCVSKTYEPISQLVQQMNYAYTQIVSILTSNALQIFARKPRFDLRTLLGGANRFLDNLSSLMDHDYSFLLNAIHCLRLESSQRSNICGAIQAASHTDLFYAILVAEHRLVGLVHPKKYPIQPLDLHLITNFVFASSAFQDSESWTPLCLPKFSDAGFLHTYICFIEKGICLLLLSTKPDSFYSLSRCKDLIVQGLQKTFSLDAVLKAHSLAGYSVSELGIPSLLHFLYKSNVLGQFTHPLLEAPYTSRKSQKRLMRLYQLVHRRVHRFRRTHKVYYQVSQTETLVSWVTSGFELYAVFGPLELKSACIKACNDILKWIKNEESSLFMLNNVVW